MPNMNITDRIFDNLDGKNLHISRLEFRELGSDVYIRRDSNKVIGLFFCGHPVIFRREDRLIWFKCEYCGTKEYPITRGDYVLCSKCGAPI
jgi:hypothetical protein